MEATQIDSAYYTLRNRLFPSLIAPKGDSEIHQVSLKNALVRYRITGKGRRTVVLCPDLPNIIDHDDALIERLGKRAKVVCVEMPGQGFSFPGMKFGFGLSDYADVLIQLMEKLSLRKVTLATPCLYSFAALWVAHTRPDLIQKLVFTQTPSLAAEQDWCLSVDFKRKNILHRPIVGQILMLTGQSLVTKKWYHYARGENDFYDGYLKTTLEAYAQGACFCLASLFQEFQKWTLPKNLKLKQEVVSIWGLADRSHRTTAKDSLLLHAPKAKIISFSDCGHFPELDRSREFSEIVLS